MAETVISVFSKAALGFHYRVLEPDGRYSAGPMVQSNTIATVPESGFGIHR